MKKIFIIAGELSGDFYGARLIENLKKARPDIEFYGIGGEEMEAQGLKSLFPMKEISLMGFAEVIPHFLKILKLMKLTIKKVKEIQPDILITIDSPGFNYNIAKRLRRDKLKCKFVHYVAPTVWAYKENRAEKFAKIYDHLICILPFEEKYFQKYGLSTSFIGHPIIEKYQFISDENESFRDKYNISEHDYTLAVTPGSRLGEIERLMPIIDHALALLRQKLKSIKVFFIAGNGLADNIKTYIKSEYDYYIISDEKEKYQAIKSAKIALAKSGTNSFELAILHVPMVIIYKVNPISAFLLKKMISIKFFNLINIIQGEEVIPELIQNKCTPENIAQKLYEYIFSPDARNKQIEKSHEVLKILGYNGDIMPSEKCARIILDML